MSLRRLNWGCGTSPPAGWINSDVREGPGIDMSCDIRGGLPIESGTLDYIVSIHALPMIPLPDLDGVLRELRRMLRLGGVLRLGLPDLHKGVAALHRQDRDYFLVPDEDATSLDAKLIVQLLWYGYSVTLFTPVFAEEVLRRAGFSEVVHCDYRVSGCGLAGIIDLDNRPAESFFVEATK